MTARGRAFALAASGAVLAGALWLGAPNIRYLVVGASATAAAAVTAVLLPARARWWGVAAVAAAAAFWVQAAVGLREVRRADREWSAYRASVMRDGATALEAELREATRSLRAMAERALDAPVSNAAAFRTLESLAAREPAAAATGRALLVYRGGQLLAWRGRLYADPSALTAPLGVVFSSFYVTLYVTARRGETHAAAATVVHAHPPANRLATALDARVARRTRLTGFEFSPVDRPAVGDGAEYAFAYAPDGAPLLRVRPLAPSRQEATLLLRERLRARGVILLAVAFVLFVAATWRLARRLRWRLAPLAVGLACLGFLPLTDAFSTTTDLFDPTVYYADTLGPYTANVGALAIAGGIVLLALLLVPLARARVPRWAGLALVLALMAGGPFLLRELARGIMPPGGGVPAALWLAWEVALFLAAASLLVAAAAAGSAALGGSRGLHPALAPALAAGAALAGPLVLQPDGGWPGWYALVWIAAIGALALTRRHRTLVFTAASVAALGSTTLSWNAGVRGRIALAARDLAGLNSVDPYVMAALERFSSVLAAEGPATSEGALLRRYVRSDLVGSGYPVALAQWTPAGPLAASVASAPVRPPPGRVEAVVAAARNGTARELRVVHGDPGAFAVLAVPHADGSVTSVVVGPRSRFIPDDPFAALLGLEQRPDAEPPYNLTFTALAPDAPVGTGAVRWQRAGNTMHGEAVVPGASAPVRAHVEIELRTLDSLIERGTLVVLLDLLVILALWLLSVLPQGAFGRWLRARLRRWAASYRARLTVALFAFFVLPAAAFATWSYRQLRAEDRQSRELLVRETLRTVAEAGGGESLREFGERLRAPLFVYRGGALYRSSEPLFLMLAPIGRLLASEVAQDLRAGSDEYESRIERVGDVEMLFGYRPASLADAGPVIVAAPARGSDVTLDRRRNDLGVLVLFATALAGLAALWLSGVAARSLEQPIGRLRTAALAIAAGEREPPLPGTPPVEFSPVFSAFRRMAADLGESRAALEAAQRQMSMTLRNVASGVVAVDGAGLVTVANPRAETLLHATVVPMAPIEAVAPAELASRVRAFLASSADEEEFEVVAGERQLHARLTRVAGGPGASGAVLTLDDVTELARAQRVLAWGEMARQVAHEIKNPLTPIRLGVQHLQRAYADARSDFEEILMRNARRILAEIDRLDEIARSFSRYGSVPTDRLPAERTDVAAVARDVVDLERMGRDGVEWVLDGGTGPVYARARADELREVLLNVLENARLAGARRVAARLDRVDGGVMIEVHDDGRGIPAAVLPRIFEPHFSTRTSGSGLGLAVSRQIVEGWGGEIGIQSVEGEGTTVRITLRASDSGVGSSSP